MSVFALFVQVGRVAQIENGEHATKLVAIIDIIDQNRVLVDGPGFKKAEANLKNLNLLPILLTGVSKDTKPEDWKAAWVSQEVDKKFAATRVSAIQSQRKIRASLNDFQRYQVKVLKKERNVIVNEQFKVLADKHKESEIKRLAPHRALLAKIQKQKKMAIYKNSKKLARKINKRGQAAAEQKKSARIEKYLSKHPEAKLGESTIKKQAPKARTPGRQRKASDEPARLKRRGEGRKKRAEKLAKVPKVEKVKGIKPKAKKAPKTEAK